MGVYCQLAACDFRNLYRYQLIKGGAGGAFCGRVCQDKFDGIQIPVFGGVNIGGSFISGSAGRVAGGCSVGRRGQGAGSRTELLQAVSERAMAPVMIIAIIFFMVIFSFLILNISLLRKQKLNVYFLSKFD